jgi:DNA (cytosine-5)-methyltransferase 1
MKKIKVLDLFAGAGGFSLGFGMANFDILGCLEVDKWACDTLRYNKNCKIVEADIRDFTSEYAIRTVFNEKPDVIIGGPPCQGFSTAGKTYDPNDPRNSLFENFAQWIEVLTPSVFVMENVQALTFRKTSDNKNVIDIIKKRFQNIGYNVDVWLLNAVNYGVPQLRERIFVVGTLNERFGDEKFTKPIPTHSINDAYIPNQRNFFFENLRPAITVGEAINDLPVILARQGLEEMPYHCEAKSAYQKLMREGSDTLFNHVAMNHTKRLVKRYQEIINGTKLNELEDDLKVKRRNGQGNSEVTYNSNYRLLLSDKESMTIPASFYSNFVHPFQPRNITAREAARIQSFPDYYRFMGKRTQISGKLLAQLGKQDEDFLSQYNQIGNAVPPLLAKQVANKVMTFLQRFPVQKQNQFAMAEAL